MDTFDMESEFKNKRYSQNKESLKRLCNQLDIPTSVGEKVSKGFETVNDATGGCLGVIAGYIAIAFLIGLISTIFSAIF